MIKKLNNWWEGICTGCGICCHEKEFTTDGIVIINFDKPCKYLDKCNNKCKIYDVRFKQFPICKKVNIFEALFNPYLPPSCGYVRKFRFWEMKKRGR